MFDSHKIWGKKIERKNGRKYKVKENKNRFKVNKLYIYIYIYIYLIGKNNCIKKESIHDVYKKPKTKKRGHENIRTLRSS